MDTILLHLATPFKVCSPLAYRDGALYRIHPGGISMRKAAICAQYEIVIRAIKTFGYDGPDGRPADRAKIRARLAQVCFGHAYGHFRGGNAKVAADFFGKAMGLGKRNFKTRCYWGISKLKSLFFGK